MDGAADTDEGGRSGTTEMQQAGRLFVPLVPLQFQNGLDALVQTVFAEIRVGMFEQHLRDTQKNAALDLGIYPTAQRFGLQIQRSRGKGNCQTRAFGVVCGEVSAHVHHVRGSQSSAYDGTRLFQCRRVQQILVQMQQICRLLDAQRAACECTA